MFGDRALRLWLELLSIADRNDGFIPGWNGADSFQDCSPQIRRSLAGKCRLSGERVQNVLRFFDERAWTEPGFPHRVRNHTKYRVMREDKQILNGKPSSTPPTPTPTPTPHTTYSKEYVEEPPIVPLTGDAPALPPAVKTTKEPAYSKGFCSFWFHYPKKTGKDKAWGSWQKRKLESLTDTIVQKVNEQKTWRQWVIDDGRYIPNPMTYLNEGRWKDEPLATVSHTPPSRMNKTDVLADMMREAKEKEEYGH